MLSSERLLDNCRFVSYFWPPDYYYGVFRHWIPRQFHGGHPGLSKMKSLARRYSYWPPMNRGIEQKCRSSWSCLEAAKICIKAEPQPSPKLDGPRERIHANFAGQMQSRNHLAMVGDFTNWPEVYGIPNTLENTIRKLSRLFACFGVMEILVTDNDTQFILCA